MKTITVILTILLISVIACLFHLSRMMGRIGRDVADMRDDVNHTRWKTESIAHQTFSTMRRCVDIDIDLQNIDKNIKTWKRDTSLE